MAAAPAWTVQLAWESALETRLASLAVAQTSADRLKQTEGLLNRAQQRLDESGPRLDRRGSRRAAVARSLPR